MINLFKKNEDAKLEKKAKKLDNSINKKCSIKKLDEERRVNKLNINTKINEKVRIEKSIERWLDDASAIDATPELKNTANLKIQLKRKKIGFINEQLDELFVAANTINTELIHQERRKVMDGKKGIMAHVYNNDKEIVESRYNKIEEYRLGQVEKVRKIHAITSSSEQQAGIDSLIDKGIEKEIERRRTEKIENF